MEEIKSVDSSGIRDSSAMGVWDEKMSEVLTRGERELIQRAGVNTHDQKTLLEVDFERARNKINVQDERGNTPLHTAVVKLHFANVEILLKRGADKEMKNKNSQTPLQFLFTIDKSSENKEPLYEMTRLLLEYGAKPVQIPRSKKWKSWHSEFCQKALDLIEATARKNAGELSQKNTL